MKMYYLILCHKLCIDKVAHNIQVFVGLLMTSLY